MGRIYKTHAAHRVLEGLREQPSVPGSSWVCPHDMQANTPATLWHLPPSSSGQDTAPARVTMGGSTIEHRASRDQGREQNCNSRAGPRSPHLKPVQKQESTARKEDASSVRSRPCSGINTAYFKDGAPVRPVSRECLKTTMAPTPSQLGTVRPTPKRFPNKVK